MPSTFPSSIDVFNPHPPVDGFDFVMADHIGQLQDALVAVETALGENMENVDPAAVTNAAPAKSTPDNADKIGLWDSVGLTFKSLTWANLKTALASVFDWATITHAASQKTTPVDADELSLADSAASFGIKKFTLANLKTALASVFDWATTTHAATNKVTPATSDEFSLADSAASFVAKRITWGQIISALNASFALIGTVIPNDGWISATGETWTYWTASSFRVTGDKRSIYRPGVKLYCVQSSTVKYWVVASSTYFSPYTTVNILVNTDHTVANAAITNNLYSFIENPLGWPDSFNFSPVWAGLTLGNGAQVAKVSVKGNWVEGNVNVLFGSTTSISGAVTINLPIPASGYAGTYTPCGSVSLVDTVGGALYMGATVLQQTNGNLEVRVIQADGTYARWAYISATVPHTWASGNKLDVNFRYRI